MPHSTPRAAVPAWSAAENAAGLLRRPGASRGERACLKFPPLLRRLPASPLPPPLLGPTDSETRPTAGFTDPPGFLCSRSLMPSISLFLSLVGLLKGVATRICV